MRKATVIGLLSALLACSSQARAEAATAKTVLQMVDEGGETERLALMALLASTQSFSVASIFAEDAGPPLFCQPKKLALEGKQAAGILKAYVEKYPAMAEFPVYIVMLYALKYTFPCE